MQNTCPCGHHKVIPFLALLVALIFLLNSLGYVGDFATQISWPIALGIASIIKMFDSGCSCC